MYRVYQKSRPSVLRCLYLKIRNKHSLKEVYLDIDSRVVTLPFYFSLLDY